MIKYMLFILATVVIASCKNNSSKPASNVSGDSMKNVRKEVPEKSYVRRLAYNNPLVKIWADSSIDSTKIHSTSLLFEPYVSFNDYKIGQMFKGKKSAINYRSNSLGSQLKTRLTETYEEDGLNFAGHYCFVHWGCGSPCQESAIIDLTDGKIYNGLGASNGFNFKKDSRMLIVNPPDSAGFYDDCFYCHPQIWILDEKTKEFKELKAVHEN